jgi:putative FmdB family regulatory protein
VPTYQYRCTECGEELEVVQKFSDDALTVCPACQGSLRKIFSPVGIVFKGSGFYRNDSRNGSAGAKKDKEPAAKPGESAGSSETAKPAANGSSSSSSADSGSGSGSGSSGSSGTKKDATSSSSASAPAATGS